MNKLGDSKSLLLATGLATLSACASTDGNNIIPEIEETTIEKASKVLDAGQENQFLEVNSKKYVISETKDGKLEGNKNYSSLTKDLVNVLDKKGIKIGKEALSELESKIKEAQNSDGNYISTIFDNGLSFGERIIIDITKFHGDLSLDVYLQEQSGKKGPKLFTIDKGSEKNIVTSEDGIEKKKDFKIEKKSNGDVLLTFVGLECSSIEREEGNGPGKKGTDTRFAFSAGVTKGFGNNLALTLASLMGEEQLSALLQAGIELGKNRVFISIEGYTEERNFGEIYDKEREEWLKQYKVTGKDVIDITDWLRLFVGAKFSKVPNEDIAKIITTKETKRTYTTQEEDKNNIYIHTWEQKTIYYYMNDTDLIGGKKGEIFGGAEVKFGANTITGEIKYTDEKLNNGEERKKSFGWGGDWKIVDGRLTYKAGYHKKDDTEKFSAGLSILLDNGGQFSPNIYVEDRDGEKIYGGGISYSQPLWLGDTGKKSDKPKLEKSTNSKKSLVQETQDEARKNLSKNIDTPNKVVETKTYLYKKDLDPKLISTQTIKKQKPKEDNKIETETFDNLEKENFETIKKGETYNLPNFAEIIECRLIEGEENVSKNANGGYDTIKVGTFKFEIKNPETNEKKYITVTIEESDETAPILGKDVFKTEKDTPLKVAQSEFEKNDKDNDGKIPKMTGKFKDVKNGKISMNDGVVTIDPDTGFVGKITGKYEGKDLAGNLAWGDFEIEVFDNVSGTPPKIVNPGDQSFTVGDTVNIPIQINKTEGDDFNENITLSVPGLSYSNGKITGKPTNSGTYTVTIKATDDDGTNTEKFTITVIATNTAPTARISGNTQVVSGGTTSVTCGGTDAENNIKEYNLDGNISSSPITKNLGAGVHTCKVTDTGNLSDTDSLNIEEIIPTNQAPTATITKSGNDLICNGTDTDGTVVNTIFGTQSGVAQAILPDPMPGTYTCTVTDNDGATYSETYTVNTPTNTAPTLSNPTATGDLEASTQIADLGLDIADDDLSKVTWSLSYTHPLDSGSFSQSSGTGDTLHGITFTANPGYSNNRTITVTITDTGSGETKTKVLYSN